MRDIHVHFPKQLVFGDHCYDNFISTVIGHTFKKVFIIADPNVHGPLIRLTGALGNEGINSMICSDIKREPTVNDFNTILRLAEMNNIDSVIGIGGGSILDMAKLLAALYRSGQKADTVIGQGKIRDRCEWS